MPPVPAVIPTQKAVQAKIRSYDTYLGAALDALAYHDRQCFEADCQANSGNTRRRYVASWTADAAKHKSEMTRYERLIKSLALKRAKHLADTASALGPSSCPMLACPVWDHLHDSLLMALIRDGLGVMECAQRMGRLPGDVANRLLPDSQGDHARYIRSGTAWSDMDDRIACHYRDTPESLPSLLLRPPAEIDARFAHFDHVRREESRLFALGMWEDGDDLAHIAEITAFTQDDLISILQAAFPSTDITAEATRRAESKITRFGRTA